MHAPGNDRTCGKREAPAAAGSHVWARGWGRGKKREGKEGRGDGEEGRGRRLPRQVLGDEALSGAGLFPEPPPPTRLPSYPPPFDAADAAADAAAAAAADASSSAAGPAGRAWDVAQNRIVNVAGPGRAGGGDVPGDAPGDGDEADEAAAQAEITAWQHPADCRGRRALVSESSESYPCIIRVFIRVGPRGAAVWGRGARKK